jgi:tetratricopeptide (TPR) repeat protein
MKFLQRAVTLAALAIVPVLTSSVASGEPESPSPKNTPLSHSDSRPLEAGWQAYQRGDLVEALVSYQAASVSSPNDPSIWYDLGCLYALNRELIMARRALELALNLNPQFAAALDALGQLEEQAGNLESALGHYKKASDLAPRTVRYLRHTSRVLLGLNRTVEAQQALLRLVNLAPSDLEARYELGVLRLRSDAPDLAIYEFNQVLKQRPRDVLALNGLAIAYARIGAFPEALNALKDARMLEPQSAATQTNFGVVAAEQEHWVEAREAWLQALKLNPDFLPAAKNLEALKKLRASSDQ